MPQKNHNNECYNPLEATQKFFRNYLYSRYPFHVDDIWPYDDWMKACDEDKAAILYLAFYRQVRLAWSKANSINQGDESEAVETAMQYLQKNVSKMVENRSKYSAAYIYRVMYNCLYCIAGHDRKRDKDRIQYEVSNIVYSGDEELDLFDVVSRDNGDVFEDMSMQSVTFRRRQEFWAIIEGLGRPTQIVVSEILGETAYSKADRAKISETDRAQILETLRTELAPYLDIFADLMK